MGKVLVVVSGKGGTGKTSLSAGVSSALALMGRRVLAVDADAGLRNLDIVLGMDGEMLLSFADVILKRCTLSDAVKRHPTIANLSMVPAPAVEMPRGVDGAGVLRFVSEAAARYAGKFAAMRVHAPPYCVHRDAHAALRRGRAGRWQIYGTFFQKTLRRFLRPAR